MKSSNSQGKATNSLRNGVKIRIRIYFRYVAGQKEYEVELQFTSGLLGFPDRTNDPQSVVDGNDPILDEDAEAEAALAASRSSRRGSTVSGHSDAKSEVITNIWKVNFKGDDLGLASFAYGGAFASGDVGPAVAEDARRRGIVGQRRRRRDE